MKKSRIRNIDQGVIMKLNKILRNAFLIIVASFALSACAVSKKSTGQMQGDVYTGNENKTRFVLSIINSCLGDFYYSEGAISPKCVSETRKACLLYLSS